MTSSKTKPWEVPKRGWTMDRRGRWRSKEWLDFVRSLPCSCRDPRCPNCHTLANGRGPVVVVAAHLRLGARTGMGAKPDDFLTYPLSDWIHREYHNGGQQSVEWQMERVVQAWRAAWSRGMFTFGDTFLAMLPF